MNRHEQNWPTNDREWARSHVGCNVTACPKMECQARGECKDLAAVREEQSRKHGG